MKKRRWTKTGRTGCATCGKNVIEKLRRELAGNLKETSLAGYEKYIRSVGLFSNDRKASLGYCNIRCEFVIEENPDNSTEKLGLMVEISSTKIHPFCWYILSPNNRKACRYCNIRCDRGKVC